MLLMSIGHFALSFMHVIRHVMDVTGLAGIV
jgi:hypothetical protein